MPATSSLAAQLAKLSGGAQGYLLQKNRPSLLFDKKQALQLDKDSLLSLARTGLEDLISQNSAFKEFESTLFSDKFKDLKRSLMIKEENEKMDELVTRFLQLLSPYFLQSCSFKVLEWLIRQFEVNEMNIDEMMRCILPYHETRQFVKVLQTLLLENNDRWSFLMTVQKSQVPLDRTTLVQKCSKDNSILTFICDTAKKSWKSNIPHRSLYVFLACTLVHYIQSATQVTQQDVLVLLPPLTSFVKIQAPEFGDLQAAAQMALTQMAAKVQFDTDLVIRLLNAIAKGMTTTNMGSCLLMTVTICQLQVELLEFPETAMETMLSFPGLANEIVSICSSYVADKFMTPFLKSLLSACLKDQGGTKIYSDVIDSLCRSGYVKEPLSTALCQIVIAAVEVGADKSEVTTSIFKLMHLAFSSVMDKCLAAYFAQLDAEKKSLDPVFRLSKALLKGTFSEPISDSGTSLFLSLENPNAGLRLCALKALSEHLASESQSDLSPEVVQDILLNRLSDDSLDIVKFVLKMKDLPRHVTDHTRLGQVLIRHLWSDINIDIRALAIPILVSLRMEESCGSLLRQSLFACAFASKETRRFTQVLHSALTNATACSELFLLSSIEIPDQFEKPDDWVKYNVKLAKAICDSNKFTEVFVNGLESANANLQAVSFLVVMNAVTNGCLTRDMALQSLGAVSRLLLSFEEVSEMPALDSTGFPDSTILTDMTRVKSCHFKEAKLLPKLCLALLHNLIGFIIKSGKVNSWTLQFKATASFEHFAYKAFSIVASIKNRLVVDKLTECFFTAQPKVPRMEFCSSIVTNDVSADSKCLAIRLLKTAIDTKTDFQVLIPSVLVACYDIDSNVRMGAFDLAKALALSYDSGMERTIYQSEVFYGSSSKQIKSLKPKKTKQFLNDLLARREEIMADPTFLSVAMRTILAGKDDIVSFLLSNVEAFPYVSVQHKLMKILSNVSSPLKVKALISTIECMVKSQALTEEQCDLAAEIIRSYSPQSVEVVFKSKNYRYASVFLDLLKYHESLEHQKLCAIALKQLDSEFFSAAGVEKQCLIVDSLIRLISEASADLAQDVREAVNRIPLTADHIAHQLTKFKEVLDRANAVQSKKAKNNGSDLPNTLHLITVLLEVMESQNSIFNAHEAIPHLFSLLKTTVGMESSGSHIQLEYIKQLTMSTLNTIFKSLLVAKVCVEESIVDIDSVIQSVRMTQNAQTHNAAFLLLSTIASSYPNLVLQSVMPIFTFMGANVLPRDDEFSFYVIRKTVDVLLPALVLNSDSSEIHSIIEVFMDALYHIPRHRRLPIFKILVERLGEDVYLGQILIMIISKARLRKERSSSTNLEFAHQLIAEFGVMTQLSGLIHMLHSVHDLLQKDENDEEDSQGATQMIRFTRIHIASKAFASSVLSVPECRRAERQLTLVESLLMLISKSEEKALFEALNTVVDLLSFPKFVETLITLMHHENAAICIRAISMMEEKIQAIEENDESTEVLTCLISELRQVLEAISADDRNELLEKKQVALSCMGVLARFMAKKKPVLFAETMPLIIGENGILHADPRLSSSAMVTLSFICTGISSRILPYLPIFMPSILHILSQSLSTSKRLEHDLNGLVCQASFMALQAIVDTIPTFVSPYVPTIISYAISPAACSLDTAASVLEVLAAKVPARVVLPGIVKQIPAVFESGPESVQILFKFLTSVFGSVTRSEVTQFMPALTTFFLESFDVRRQATNLTEDELSSCETDIINSFLQLVLKLNETYFKPLFLKTVDWCTLNISFDALEQKEKTKRQLVMFKLMVELLDRLKSLAVPYYGYVLDTSLSLLTSISKAASPDALALWKLNLLSLTKYFAFDDQEDGAMDDKRFEKILKPLLDQVEMHGAHGSDYLTHMMDFVIPAIGQFALRASSEHHRKALNRAVCMTTRSSHSEVRLAGIYLLKELYDKVGDAMLVFFPETIPFLAELMEDEDEDVEGACQDLCAVIQEYLGEPIQQYFMSS